MFKSKCEKIDVNYLTWHNMLKKYEDYQSMAGRGAKGPVDPMLAENMQSYKEIVKCLIDIADVISNQIFDKMTTIPYAIRQFCKCLY